MGAAVQAGDAVEVKGDASAEEGREPGGVLGLDAADVLERAIGPEGVDVQRVGDDEPGTVLDGELVPSATLRAGSQRQRLDGVLVGGDADELGRDREVAEAVAEREGDGVQGLARDPSAALRTGSLGRERGEDVVGPAGGLVGEGVGREGGAAKDGEVEGARHGGVELVTGGGPLAGADLRLAVRRRVGGADSGRYQQHNKTATIERGNNATARARKPSARGPVTRPRVVQTPRAPGRARARGPTWRAARRLGPRRRGGSASR